MPHLALHSNAGLNAGGVRPTGHLGHLATGHFLALWPRLHQGTRHTLDGRPRAGTLLLIACTNANRKQQIVLKNRMHMQSASASISAGHHCVHMRVARVEDEQQAREHPKPSTERAAGTPNIRG